MDYLILAFAALLLGSNFAFNKLYQQSYGNTPRAAFFFNALLGASTAAIFFAINGFKADFTVYSFTMAGLMSLCVMSCNVMSFTILKMSGSIAIYTLYLMTGSMVLPYVWGLAFLGEPFSILRTIGLLLIMSGVILTNFSKGKANLKLIAMCAAVFILNGGTNIISKMHQTETVRNCVDSLDFVILGGIFKFILAGILFLIFPQKERKKSSQPIYKALLMIIISAIISGISYFLQLSGAKHLPATVLYPFITGGSIIFSALTGIIVFKERLSAKLAASILLCFCGTLLFL